MATTQLAALGVLALAGLGSAQWSDLPTSFTDIDAIPDPTEINNTSSSTGSTTITKPTTTTTVRNNCFQVSQIVGYSEGDTSFATDLSKLKTQYRDQMKLNKLKMCGTEAGFTGIQAIVEDETNSVELTQFGSNFQCQIWTIPDGSYIRKMFFAYNDSRITYVKASTEENFNFERGQQAEDDLTYEVTFYKYEPLAGFAGYVENNQVAALGFFKYMCADRPEDNTTIDDVIDEDNETNTEVDPVTDTDETDPIDGGDTDEQTDTKEENNSNQSGNQSSNGDGSDDSALDPNQTRENQSNSDNTENQLIQINDDILAEQEESSGLSLILIILIIILIPLVIVLCCIVYIFRKNRINSVEAGITRRTSTLRRRLSMDHDAIMEGKKNKAVDIFANDLEKNSAHKGLLPNDDEKAMNKGRIMDQVPDESQIEDLLRGKTAQERKKLLREIEKARQAKIHMTYLMEQQKLKNEERWAIRNIEEREAIQNIYSDHKEAQRPASAQRLSHRIHEEDRNQEGGDPTHEPKSATVDAPGSQRSEEPEVGEKQVSSARRNDYDNAEYEVAAIPEPAVSNVDEPAQQNYDSNNQGADEDDFNF